jgi:hypothetical protein
MVKFSVEQRKWVDEFLRNSPRVTVVAPTTIQAAREITPTAAPMFDVLLDNSKVIDGIPGVGASKVLMVGETGGSNTPPDGAGNKETSKNSANTTTSNTGGSGNGSGGPPSGGNSNGGGDDKTPYPGHKPTPDKAYPKQQPEPTIEETKGKATAERERRRQPGSKHGSFHPKAMKKPERPVKKFGAGDAEGNGEAVPLDKDGKPISAEELKNTKDTKLKETLTAYQKGTKGGSVKDLVLEGKSAPQLHDELIKRGFTLEDPNGRLQDWNPKTKQMEYRLRDGSFTTDKNLALKEGVPHYVYVHKDGGMVRVKPEGNPDGVRNVPHTSKSVLHEPFKNGKLDTSWPNEAFKVNDKGQAVPKAPTVEGGMREAPRGVGGWEKDRTRTGSVKPPTPQEVQRTKGYNDEQMGNVHKDMPITPKGGPGSTPGGSGASDPTKPTGGPSAKKVSIPGAEEFVHNATEHQKLSKDPKLDMEKVRKQNSSLVGEGERVAKELRTHPEFSDIRGSKVKEFYAGVRRKYGGVRAGASNLVLLALNVADAYAMVEQARYLLDSKDIIEFEKKAFELAKGAVKERIKFGILRFAFRSTPVAVGITVFLGDLDANGRMTPAELFNHEVMNMVNKVRPGAVKSLGHMGTLDQFEDDDAKKLYYEARDQAKAALKDRMTREMTDIGAEDGLTGASPKTKFEVSDTEKSILGIDKKWMEQLYKKGLEQGARKRSEAVKRAHEKGYKTGLKGEPANINVLWDFPEIEALRQRDFNREGKTDFNFTKTFEEYTTAYNEGYKEGSQKFGTRTLESLAFYEGKSITAPQYGSQLMHAIAKFTAGPDVMVSSNDGVWKSSHPDKVELKYSGKYVHAMAKAVGSSTINVKYENGGVTKEASIEMKVTAVKVQITPADATYEVGDELPYAARVDGQRFSLPYDQATWTASPEGIVKLAPVPSDMYGVADGNGVLVTMLKPGKAKLKVTSKDKSLTATTHVSVKAKVAMKR